MKRWRKLKHKPGPPLSLTGERKTQIVNLITKGWPITLACPKVGTTTETYYAEQERDPDFKARIKTAREAQPGRIRMRLGKIAETGDPTEAATMKAIQMSLAAAFPEEFGNKIRVEGIPLETLIVQSFAIGGTDPEDDPKGRH